MQFLRVLVDGISENTPVSLPTSYLRNHYCLNLYIYLIRTRSIETQRRMAFLFPETATDVKKAGEEDRYLIRKNDCAPEKSALLLLNELK